jgi:hypothetical protein
VVLVSSYSYTYFVLPVILKGSGSGNSSDY